MDEIVEIEISGLSKEHDSISALLENARARKLEISERLGGFESHDKPEYLVAAVECNELSDLAQSISSKISQVKPSHL